MPDLYGIPELVLHDILSIVIDVTRYKGWQMSLRLVNRQFNEAVLYVYFVRKRLIATLGDHDVGCIGFCGHRTPCRRIAPISDTRNYATRFNLQGFLARHDHPRGSVAYQYWYQWRKALAVLRPRTSLQQLGTDQTRPHLVLSDNETFNDVSSSILARAVCALVGPNIADITNPGPTRARGNTLASEFWVALSACVVGDLQLLDDFIAEAKPSLDDGPDPDMPGWISVPLLVYLAMVALENSQIHILEYLVKRNPQLMSTFGVRPLFSAIFCHKEVILDALLKHTPHSPELLVEVFSGGYLLDPSDTSSRIVRVLMQHFSPISKALRRHLIRQSCAIGDLALLQEFSNTQPLYDDYKVTIDDDYPWSWIGYAARYGHLACLRFLLDESVDEPDIHREMRYASRHALVFNHIKCFEEIHQRRKSKTGGSTTVRYSRRDTMMLFHFLVMADGAEILIPKFVSRFGSLVVRRGDAKDPDSLAAIAPYALMMAITQLRADNVRFLLEAGVCLACDPSYGLRDPPSFLIRWTYFNQNREAYARTQEVLDMFSLPRLEVDV